MADHTFEPEVPWQYPPRRAPAGSPQHVHMRLNEIQPSTALCFYRWQGDRVVQAAEDVTCPQCVRILATQVEATLGHRQRP